MNTLESRVLFFLVICLDVYPGKSLNPIGDYGCSGGGKKLTIKNAPRVLGVSPPHSARSHTLDPWSSVWRPSTA